MSTLGSQLEQTLVGVNVMEEEIVVNQGDVLVHRKVVFVHCIEQTEDEGNVL